MTRQPEEPGTAPRQESPDASGASPPVATAETKRHRVTSMRLIITFATVVLISVTVLGVGWVAERNAREALTTEIETRLLLEARNLAKVGTEALLSEYPELTLCPVVKETQNERDDLDSVVVLDHEGKIQGHADARKLGTEYQLPAGMRPVLTRTQLLPGESLLGDQQLLTARVPIVHGNGQQLGTVVIGLRRAYLEAMVTKARKELLIFTTACLGAGIATAFLLMSFLLRPIAILRRGLERIGRGDLDTPVRLRDRTELGLLAEAVNGMASELKASQAEMLEKERLDHEMGLARGIQQSLLPDASTRLGPYSVAAAYAAAAEVGGDYYDVFELPDGRSGLVIADVAGKGLSGCLVTSMIAVLLHSLRDEHDSPSSLLVALEKALSDFLQPGVFVTVFYGILDSRSDQFTFASAAHSPLLVYRAEAGATEWYKTKGIPLGAVKGGALAGTLDDLTIDLEPGDMAIQFTDGLNEAAHASNEEEFGFSRIADVVTQTAPSGHAAVIDGLLTRVKEWTGPQPPGDDQTVLLIHRELVAAVDTLPTPVWDSLLADRNLQSPERLHAALADSSHLDVAADLQQLSVLGEWIDANAELRHLSGQDRRLVETGLYELCANIIEHGCHRKPGVPIEIWWQLVDDDPAAGGYFVIADQGVAFDMSEWESPDLEDPVVRKQGRGLGLQIIRSAMNQVAYLPDTKAGNITLLHFVPSRQNVEEDLCNV
ncbi:MAG: SpoIIE family protein phosphatase [bacterium]